MKKRVYGFALLMCITTAGALQRAHAQASAPGILDKGPSNLLIVYKCPPENRVALRNYMEKKGSVDMARWKATGVFADDTVLFSRSTDTDNWDMQIFLRFSTPQAAANWARVERSYPAGMQAEALHLVSSISTFWLDLVESGDALTHAKAPVYFTIPYEVTVPTADYITYAHQYIVPQTLGWIAAGILQSYKLYVIRASAGRPWSAILSLTYVDDAALGAREKTVKETREKLEDNVAWKTVSNRKQSVRVEKPSIVSDPLN